MSPYSDKGIGAEMRESAERFEQILREIRALRLPPDDRTDLREKEREQRRRELREFEARVERFRRGRGGSAC